MSNEEKLLIKKYPKRALKGEALGLDADWKRGFVAFMCVALINLDLSRKESMLTSQIGDDMANVLKEEKPCELTPERKEQLRVVIRIGNLCKCAYLSLYHYIHKFDGLVMPSKMLISKEIYLYYVGARTQLLKQLEEQYSLGKDIDRGIVNCFKPAIDDGFDMDAFKAEVLAGIDTQGDIAKVMAKVLESTELSGLK